VSTVLSDFHGIDGIALSVPSVVSATGAVPIPNTPFSASELELLERSADALRGVIGSLRD
jgi:L-lactate dehydrogenase